MNQTIISFIYSETKWHKYNGHCYYFSADKCDWFTAEVSDTINMYLNLFRSFLSHFLIHFGFLFYTQVEYQ